MKENKADLKRQYKKNPQAAGIFKITNKVNGKIFIGSGQNIQGILNSQEFQLKTGSHTNTALQKDWNAHGSANFDFEILDFLKPSDNPQNSLRDDLDELETLWLEKLNPYGDNGYNWHSKK